MCCGLTRVLAQKRQNIHSMSVLLLLGQCPPYYFFK
jgi:hypothetical protein